MGCGSSKDDLNPPDYSSTDRTAGNSTTTTNQNVNHDKLKLDGANLKTSIDSPSPIELDHDDCQTVRMITENHTAFTGTKDAFKQSSPKTKIAGQNNESSAVATAWTPTQKHVKKEQVHFVNDIEDESEFGRDGIDFCSESFDKIRKKSSGKSRTDTTLSEIPSNTYPSLIDVSPRLTKKHSEEPFDPRPLIDVDKFKAANAAAKEVRIVNNNNDTGTVTIETRANVAQSVGQPASVVSPSNYQDFYDDDEIELMASIEHDFISTALPGVVT